MVYFLNTLALLHRISMKANPLLVIALLSFSWSTSVSAFAQKIAAEPIESQVVEKKKRAKRSAASAMTVTLKAPAVYAWQTLVDFDKYPEIFNRLQSVNVTKREGDFVYIESHLKPHMFVKTETQHTVNDLSGKPGLLKWELVDGNFKHVEGAWELKPKSPDSTELTYRLSVDPGPVVPAGMVSFVLHFVQREIVTSFVQYTEKAYSSKEKTRAISRTTDDTTMRHYSANARFSSPL